MKILDYINDQINEHGANNFYDSLNNCWDEYSKEVKKLILDDVFSKIKPEKIETIYDLAKLLNENTIGNELENPYNINVNQLCKEKGWAVFFPYSDDNLEICGIINDEISAWDGTIVKFVNKGDFYLADYSEYGNNDALYNKAYEQLFVTISNAECDDIITSPNTLIVESIWNPEYEDLTWDIRTNSKNCATFNIINEEKESDNNVWARCLIIDMNYYMKK